MSIMNRMNATTTVETAAVVVARVVEAVAEAVAEAPVEEALVARVNTFINTTSLVCRQTSEVGLHPPLTRHIVQACPRKPSPVPGPCSPT